MLPWYHECCWSYAQECSCMLISRHECIWHLRTILKGAHGRWWLLLVLMAANECSWALIVTHECSWALTSSYDQLWALMSMVPRCHKHSWSFIGAHEHSWEWCYEHSWVSWRHVTILMSAPEFSGAVPSAPECSWALISAQVFDLTISKNVDF